MCNAGQIDLSCQAGTHQFPALGALCTLAVVGITDNGINAALVTGLATVSITRATVLNMLERFRRFEFRVAARCADAPFGNCALWPNGCARRVGLRRV